MEQKIYKNGQFLPGHKKNMTHNLSKTKEYKTWVNIKERCFNVNCPDYKYYGLRGIKLYDDWINSPVLFINYIISLPDYKTNGYTLDRIDNNKDYEPDNLRWASPHIQMCNQRKYKSNKTGYIGVHYHKRDKRYDSYIRINSKLVHIKRCVTLQEAIEARNNYIIQNNLTEYKIQSYKD